MISVIVSWIFILFCSFSLGTAFLRCFYKSSFLENSFELYIISGLCICTVYAQFFSLFMKVGLGASILLILLAGMSFFYLIWSSYDFSRIVMCWNAISNIRKIVFGIVTCAVLVWTSISPQHYDTYLYHAQAIHWIEDYGVVPGLGNLHFRLAYDSAFMCLQALFSFKWLIGQSFHTVNGFFTLVILGKIVFTTSRKDALMVSDVLKLGMLLFALYDCAKISSPNTDTMALMLTYYIFVKWTELYEEKETEIGAFALLAVLIVFATTVKVSVGILVLLVLYPAINLIKRKCWKDILSYLLQGIIIIIPYIIRNLIISGYALYPYEITGIKSLNWIMSEETLQADRAEIIAWGRGNMDVNRNSDHIWQWFGEWFFSINILWKVLFVLSVIAIFFIVYNLVKIYAEDKCIFLIFTIAVAVGCFAFWLLMAPLPRYGAIYMIMIPCFALGFLIKRCEEKGYMEHRAIKKVTDVILFAFAIGSISIFVGYSTFFLHSMPSVFLQGDYVDKVCSESNTLGITVYIPKEGDQTGYYVFPSTPYSGMLEGIELRGEELKNGFRLK